MEYACWTKWKTQNDNINPSSAGAAGVSKRIGEHYAATMPQLKKYARDTLGFQQVVLGGHQVMNSLVSRARSNGSAVTTRLSEEDSPARDCSSALS